LSACRVLRQIDIHGHGGVVCGVSGEVFRDMWRVA